MKYELDDLLPYLLLNKNMDKNRQVALAQHIKAIVRKDEDDRTADEWFVLGYQAHAEGNLDSAIDFYTDAIGNNNAFEAAYKYRAQARMENGDEENALKDVSKAIEIDPSYLPAYLLRAELGLRKDDAKQVEADLIKAGELDGDSIRVKSMFAQLEEMRGNYDKAIAALDEILAEVKSDEELFMQRALYHVFYGNAEQAIEDFKAAQRISGGSHVMQFNYGLAYGLLPAKAREALSYFEKAFKKSHDMLAQYVKSAGKKESTRLINRLKDIVKGLEAFPADQPGKFYRDQLHELLSKKLKDAGV